jgi:lysophospholipid acyltransferase (LPLAT)-like uncharacterized protein
MKHFLLWLAGWLVGFAVLILRMTCHIRIHNDPRHRLTAAGSNHVFALLHAHQVAASMGAERGTGAMVSRSADGAIIVPALRVGGHVPIRGSSGTGGKGGATALQAILEHVNGGRPAILAVDGPRGPRGHVQKGIGLLAKKTDSAVLTAISIPSQRWVLSRTWDRLQIPKPFSTIDNYFGEPLFPQPDESFQQFAKRVEMSLQQLEAEYDPEEGTQATTEPAANQDLRAAA